MAYQFSDAMESLMEGQAEIERTFRTLNQSFEELAEECQTLSTATDDVSESMDNAAESAQDVENEIDEAADQAAEASEKMKELAGAFDSAVGMIGGAASAVGDAFQSILTVGEEYDQACQTIQQSTGATAGELEVLGQALKNAYSGGFGENMEDVAEAISSVYAQFGKELSTDELQKATEDAIVLRDALGMEVADSVQSAKTLMDAFGISASEAFGMMALGVQNGLNSSGELLASVEQYAGAFSTLGLNAQDMFGIFQSGVESGALSMEAVGAAMQTFSDNVLSGGAAAADGFADIGLNADSMTQKFAAGGEQARDAFYEVVSALAQMEDPVARNQAGAELFGDAWETLGPQVTGQLDAIRAGYDNAAEAMDGITFDQFDSFGSTAQEIKRNIETNLMEPIAQKLTPILSELRSGFQDAFQNSSMQTQIETLGDALAGLAETVGNFIVEHLPGFIEGLTWVLDHGSEIASVIAGVGAALATISIGNMIGDFAGKVSGVTGIFQAIGTGLTSLASPATLVVAAIAALVTAFITLWNTNEGFRDAVIGAWEAISAAVSGFVSAIQVFFTETLPALFAGIGEFFAPLIEAMGVLWESITTVFTEGWNAIAAFFAENIPAWLESVGAWFAQLPGKVQELFNLVLLTVQSWGANLLAFATETIPQFIESIATWFATLPERIGAFLTAVVTRVQAWGGSLLTSALTAAQGFLNTVITNVQQLPGNIATCLQQALQKLVEWGTQMLSTGKQKAGEVVTGVSEALKELPGKVVSIGGDVIKGIWQGITDMAGWIREKISGWCGSFVDGFKSALGIHSPSRVMRDEVGQMTGEGVAVGLDQSRRRVHAAAQAMQETILTTLEIVPAQAAQPQPIVVQAPQSDTGGLLSELRAIRALVAEGKVIAVDRQKLCDIVTDGQRQRAIANGRTVIPV